MEIKAILKQPYTEDERIDFIMYYGQNCKDENSECYEIKETEEALQAWGYTEEELAEQEKERVGNLKMTALDFITFLRQKGISLETINNYINSNLEIKTQLTYCQNVYCKVACMFLPVILDGVEITKEEAIFAFKNKNNEN